MAGICYVPWPAPGTGGCPCGTYPDPCGSVGECRPQGEPPAATCFPPAAACRALGNCTTCEWIAPAEFQICTGASNPLALVLTGLGVGGALLLAARHHELSRTSRIGLGGRR